VEAFLDDGKVGCQIARGGVMMNWLKKREWSPYTAGALSGVVLVLSVVIADKFFGASTSFARSAGLIEKLFGGERVAGMDYFIRYVPKIDWQWMFVVGVLIGALISSTISRTFQWQAVPDMWKGRFGTNRTKRGIVAFIGGTVAIFGARLAGG
jgi:hypothetical protein